MTKTTHNERSKGLATPLISPSGLSAPLPLATTDWLGGGYY